MSMNFSDGNVEKFIGGAVGAAVGGAALVILTPSRVIAGVMTAIEKKSVREAIRDVHDFDSKLMNCSIDFGKENAEPIVGIAKFVFSNFAAGYLKDVGGRTAHHLRHKRD